VLIFVFAGLEPDIRLQLPFLDRILDEHPEAELDFWNLAFQPEDNEYIRTLEGRRERFSVINSFYGERPFVRFNDVWRYYTDERYKDYLFTKLDQDVPFIESDRFGEFLAAVDANRDTVISAQVINNGACTKVEPKLWAEFRNRPPTNLLDVHRSDRFATMCHEFFFRHWPGLINQPVELIPTNDWLSINLIGYDWKMGVRIANLLETPSPKIIAGRRFPRRNSTMGDEGVVNVLPRSILKGFLACHLTFGPQEKRSPRMPLDAWRAKYGEIGEKYLTC
jgi:hypothetical protein